MKEVNKALYEQTIPIFITPFAIMLYDYCERGGAGNFYFWIIDIVLLTFLFHSIFVIFDIFRAFVIIAGAVSKTIEEMQLPDTHDE